MHGSPLLMALYPFQYAYYMTLHPMLYIVQVIQLHGSMHTEVP